MPKLGIADTSPAFARSSPILVCRVGIRKATPLMKTFADSVANSAMTSIVHRRTVLIVSTATRP
jgi:hypothetical protein